MNTDAPNRQNAIKNGGTSTDTRWQLKPQSQPPLTQLQKHHNLYHPHCAALPRHSRHRHRHRPCHRHEARTVAASSHARHGPFTRQRASAPTSHEAAERLVW